MPLGAVTRTTSDSSLDSNLWLTIVYILALQRFVILELLEIPHFEAFHGVSYNGV